MVSVQNGKGAKRYKVQVTTSADVMCPSSQADIKAEINLLLMCIPADRSTLAHRVGTWL